MVTKRKLGRGKVRTTFTMPKLEGVKQALLGRRLQQLERYRDAHDARRRRHVERGPHPRPPGKSMSIAILPTIKFGTTIGPPTPT